jgi:xylulose-5-phosphate/fructose-6-phosphate phosphoketolase
MTQRVELDISKARKDNDSDLNNLELLRRVTNYLAASMLYLKDNFLLENKLSIEDIKPRLLGHWGKRIL